MLLDVIAQVYKLRTWKDMRRQKEPRSDSCRQKTEALELHWQRVTYNVHHVTTTTPLLLSVKANARLVWTWRTKPTNFGCPVTALYVAEFLDNLTLYNPQFCQRRLWLKDLIVRRSFLYIRRRNRRWQKKRQESRAVTRKPRDAAAVLFGLKFADNIHYKYKSSQASKAMLQSSKHADAKQNLTQNVYSRSFKVTCFGVSGKAISD